MHFDKNVLAIPKTKSLDLTRVFNLKTNEAPPTGPRKDPPPPPHYQSQSPGVFFRGGGSGVRGLTTFPLFGLNTLWVRESGALVPTFVSEPKTDNFPEAHIFRGGGGGWPYSNILCHLKLFCSSPPLYGTDTHKERLFHVHKADCYCRKRSRFRVLTVPLKKCPIFPRLTVPLKKCPIFPRLTVPLKKCPIFPRLFQHFWHFPLTFFQDFKIQTFIPPNELTITRS